MSKKKSKRKLSICTKHDIQIKARLEKNEEWKKTIIGMSAPAAVLFITDVPEDFAEVKKICWDFGDGTKNVTVTYRKKDPERAEQKHIFRPKNIKDQQTLYVQASVFTPETVYVTPGYILDDIKIKEKNNYIDPKLFKEQLCQFYEDDILSDEIADSVQKIATRLAFRPNFINYTYREEMVGDAIIKMVQAVRSKKFDPERGNPFSYFTKIAYHAFCNRIKKEKKMRQALTDYQEETYDRLLGDGYYSSQKPNHIGNDKNENF